MTRSMIPNATAGLVLALTTAAITANASEEHPIREVLRRAARDYPTTHAFRFDPPRPRTKEPIYHQPESLGYDIERDPSALPAEARAKQLPWSGYWWPMSQNGIAHRSGSHESPIEKYSRAFQLDSQALDWEERFHGTAGEEQPSPWWGHCNGLAAASILEPRPQHAIEVNGVRFEASDIQALLCEAYFGCSALGIDRRYDGAERIELDSFGRPTSAEYRDINPGALHLLLGNVIGRDGKAIIVDISSGPEVWNHPTVGYSRKRFDETDAAGAVKAISGVKHTGPYPFHADAKRWFHVEMILEIGAAHSSPAEFESPERKVLYSELPLDYVLECDEHGNVIGGEWAGESRTNHPDFAWVPLTPSSSFTMTPSGERVVGSSGSSNPFVVYEEVKALLDRSINASDIAGTDDSPRQEGTPLESTSASPELRNGPARWDRPLPETPSQVVRVFQVADSAIAHGDHAAAIAQIDLAITERQTASNHPETEDAVLNELRLRRGWAHFLAGDYDAAMTDYLDQPSTPSIAPVAYARRALIRVCRGDETWIALIDAAKAIQANPENPWGYCARGWVYLTRAAEHDLERAIADFEHAARLGAQSLIIVGLERAKVRACELGVETRGRLGVLQYELPHRWMRPFLLER